MPKKNSIGKAGLVTMVGYWPSFFFFLVFSSRLMKSQTKKKQERGQYPAIFSSISFLNLNFPFWSITHVYFRGTKKFCSWPNILQDIFCPSRNKGMNFPIYESFKEEGLIFRLTWNCINLTHPSNPEQRRNQQLCFLVCLNLRSKVILFLTITLLWRVFQLRFSLFERNTFIPSVR